MRRSKAPSVLKKAKHNNESITYLEPEDHNICAEDHYDWGSRKSKSQNFNQKRIFNVVWRDVSTRKHKIWKGDGMLEIDNIHMKAILKDEAGKFMGCLTKVDINKLIPNFQMIMSGKEIEIQGEIKDEEEFLNLRKIQVENWAKEGFTSLKDKIEEDKKPKGGFKFNPILLLKSPKLLSVERKTENRNFSLECRANHIQNQNLYDSKDNSASILSATYDFNEFICFLKPSELQQFLFQKILKFVSSVNSNSIEELDLIHVLKLICNHPSFIGHKNTTNKLLLHLIPLLPDWSEMGPFDSCKLEFVQYFLTDLTISNHHPCIILTKNLYVLNMLQGLCDFMKINCLRLYSNALQNIPSEVSKFCYSKNSYVILINSLEILSCFKFSDFSNKILVFEEYFEISNKMFSESFNDITIYYLVTAFSIEELLLLNSYEDQNVGDLIYDLFNAINKDYDCCYLHCKIQCNCFKICDKNFKAENVFTKNWKHLKTPFDMNLLKIYALDNSSENVVTIFCKKNNQNVNLNTP